jgi:hypothetical protein
MFRIVDWFLDSLRLLPADRVYPTLVRPLRLWWQTSPATLALAIAIGIYLLVLLGTFLAGVNVGERRAATPDGADASPRFPAGRAALPLYIISTDETAARRDLYRSSAADPAHCSIRLGLTYGQRIETPDGPELVSDEIPIYQRRWIGPELSDALIDLPDRIRSDVAALKAMGYRAYRPAVLVLADDEIDAAAIAAPLDDASDDWRPRVMLVLYSSSSTIDLGDSKPCRDRLLVHAVLDASLTTEDVIVELESRLGQVLRAGIDSDPLDDSSVLLAGLRGVRFIGRRDT